MPKPRICSRLLLPLFLLGGLCSGLPSAPLSGRGYLSPSDQQQSSQPAAAPDSTPASSAEQKLNFSEQVIQDVLEPLRKGVSVQNINQIMAVFDKGMPGYGGLQQQFNAFFQLYSEVNFHYQILQVRADRDHGSATAEIEMDALPYEVSQIPVRRSVQMRFKLKQTANGWKIAEFTPADFFSPGFSRAQAQ